MTAIRSDRWSATVASDLSLRAVEADGARVLDGIMIAVRDADWATADTELESLEESADGSTAWFVCRQHSAQTDIRWSGQYRADGERLTAALVGEALIDQSVNRAGFALLHALELEGARLRVRNLAGESVGEFPKRIAPLPIATDVTGMTILFPGYASLDIAFEGDEFELEDHRNWTDAGWKSYVTPLGRPAPRQLARGDQLAQQVVMRLGPAPVDASPRTRRAPASSETVEVRLGAPNGRMPQIASSVADRELSARDVAAIRGLGLSGLDVELIDGDRPDHAWECAVAQSIALDVPLSVSLVVENDSVDEWVARLTDSPAQLAGISAFDPATNGSTPELIARLQRLRRGLPAGIVLGSGTRGYFAQLNRLPHAPLPTDAVMFSVSPEVHHTDDELVLDTLRGQSATVRDAAILGQGAPVHVGPVTLRQRTDVLHLPPPPTIQEDPDLVDPRQHRPFGAVWTLGAVAGLSDAQRISLFRVSGDAGMVPTNSEPGRLADIVRAMSAAAGFPRRRLAIDDDRRVVGIAFDDADGTVIWVGNRSTAPLEIRLPNTEDHLSLNVHEVRMLRVIGR